MPRVQLDSMSFELPKGWASSVLMLHLEEPVAPDDPQPFVPSMVISRRIEVAPSDPIDQVLAGALESLESELAEFKLREQQQLKLGAAEARSIEYDYTDARGMRLRQLTLLHRMPGADLYAITATELAKRDFARVRRALTELAESFSRRA